MLFAPKAGSELRSQLTESAEQLRSRAGDFGHQHRRRSARSSNRGREAYDRARSSVMRYGVDRHVRVDRILGPEQPGQHAWLRQHVGGYGA
jgi:hypothetical protein